MSAWKELQDKLRPGETIEGIVFGAWGWGSIAPGDGFEPGYGEPEPPAVPVELRGKVLSPEDAEPYMQSWSFSGGYGAPDCYAVYIWTSERVFWVTQYDGATWLDSAPRNPINVIPDMPGG